MLTSPTLHLSTFISTSLIRSFTDYGLILFHLVFILSLKLKALYISYILSARYSLSITFLEISIINCLSFITLFKFSVCHFQVSWNNLILIGTWSDILYLHMNFMSMSNFLIMWVKTTSIFVSFYVPHPFLVHRFDSHAIHPLTYIYSLNSK